MGNWNISIRGVGQHHNGSDKDAEQMAAKFVDALKAAGHSIVAASITTGGENEISGGADSYGLLPIARVAVPGPHDDRPLKDRIS